MATKTKAGSTESERLHVALGTVLRARRLKAKLTQERFAAASGYAQNFIGIVERGEKSLSVRALFDFADVLGTTPSSILKAVESKMK